MKREREFIVPCSNVVDDIWWPERSCFPEEELTEIVHCKDCVSCDNAVISVSWCLAWDCGTKPDGFCHNGRRRDG